MVFWALNRDSSAVCRAQIAFLASSESFWIVGVCQMDELLWNASVDLLEADDAGIC